MDILILVGSFTIVCLMGMPVAYALGIAAILSALYTGIPLEAVMLKVAEGMTISLCSPFLFSFCRRHHGRRRHGDRLVNLAKVFVGVHPRRHGAG